MIYINPLPRKIIKACAMKGELFMKRAFLLTLIFVILFPLAPSAAGENQVKAAFIRDGNWWTFIDGKETQVTDSGKVFAKPQWSADGDWLIYQIETLSEIYNE